MSRSPPAVSVSADGSKGVKRTAGYIPIIRIPCFSIRRWIEGCEAQPHSGQVRDVFRFSIRRWIEGCEAPTLLLRAYLVTLFQYPQMDRRV